LRRRVAIWSKALIAALAASLLMSCGTLGSQQTVASATSGPTDVSVAVAKVARKNLAQTLTISSELVPFQEIDVYAKESGYVTDLRVDYGSHVKANDILAVLEIPELQSQLKEDDAAIKNASDQITHAQNELARIQATYKALKANSDRLSAVAKSNPALVAQQEVDDQVAKTDASAEQIEAANSNIASAQSLLSVAQAKKEHDQVLFDYTKITAPFNGVVTQRYANKGTLLQAGTNSSTQAMPLVKLSEDDLFRLVIPVPESDVRFIHLGDSVSVIVPSLNNRTFPGTVARFSEDVSEATRTMHTEVDVPNPQRILMPGMYAQATIALEKKNNALTVPLQALTQNGDQSTVDVVNSSNTIEIRPVATGLLSATDAEIVSGLQNGDTVVVGDRSGLRAGQAVRPQVTSLMQYQGQEEQK
jgi:RND family efflux transporter MFP subunit